MARLPVPGADNNVWGEVLNTYLSVEHASDGSLKDVARPSDVDAKYTKPSSGIPASDLSNGVQSSLAKADVAASVPPSSVTTVYVATGGSDSADGRTWSSAFATLAAAVATLPNGGVIMIGAGDFTISSGIQLPVLIDGSMILQGAGAGQTRIAFSGSGYAFTIGGGVSASDTRYVQLQDFTLTGTTNASGAIKFNSTRYCSLKRLVLKTFQRSTARTVYIVEDMANYFNVIEDCRFDTGTTAIYLAGNANGANSNHINRCWFGTYTSSAIRIQSASNRITGCEFAVSTIGVLLEGVANGNMIAFNQFDPPGIPKDTYRAIDISASTVLNTTLNANAGSIDYGTYVVDSGTKTMIFTAEEQMLATTSGLIVTGTPADSTQHTLIVKRSTGGAPLQVWNPVTTDGRASINFRADRDTTQEYDLGIDTGGGALKAFELKDRTKAGYPVLWKVTKNGDVVHGTTALTASATAGFTFLSSVPSAPSGTPSTQTGTIAVAPESSADSGLWLYANSVWQKVRTDSGSFRPSDHSYAAWTYDPAMSTGSTALPVAGSLYLSKINVPQSCSVANIIACVATAGNSLTSGQCFVALFKTDGTLVAQTEDQSTAWSSTGLKTMALAGGSRTLARGAYQIGFWFNGTTGPALQRTGVDETINNANLSSPNLRASVSNTGLTTTAPATYAAQTGSAQVWWAALA